MSREEKLTIRCNRCGRTVTWDGNMDSPDELKDWKCLKVLGVLGEEHPFAIIMGLGIKNFDLCKECFAKFQETFLSILPPEILKAFEEKPEEKPKEGGDSEQDRPNEQDKKDAHGSDP
jgi:hypothetical protein